MDPSKHPHLDNMNLDDVKKCPAFHHHHVDEAQKEAPPTSCPFHEALPKINDAARNCPAFKQGCPFKDAHNVDQINQIVDSIPANHKHCPAFAQTMQENIEARLRTVLAQHADVSNEIIQDIKNRRKDLFDYTS